ncbi:MAG: hypothetical protein IJE07_12935 [Clostridia bacterium]|nr:hypothetical protein [Clostridia bacterium]
MIRRMLAILLACVCLLGTAQAGGNSTGKRDAHLVQQEGAYAPRYSSSCTLEVLPGESFTLVLYEDSGTLALRASRNGGSIPSGADLITRTRDGVRQACLTGLVYAEGTYGFSAVVQETDAEGGSRTLAILHVTLRITADAAVTEAYLGDGQGMLRITIDGVNFRRTPGGTRLGQYDEGTRMVWCSTQEKGGYTWYRVWTADFGYGYVRGDMVQEEPPMRLVYTPGKETAFPIFITAGVTAPLTPSLIMTQNPDCIGFDTQPLVNVVRGADTWTLLCFTIDGDGAFFIHVDLRDEYGAPIECQLIYLTPRWEDVPEYVNN